MRRRTETTTKKRMSAEDRRKSILETTISFISQFGFWGFTIRDVAQAQNITEAGLLTTTTPRNSFSRKPSSTPIASIRSPSRNIWASKA